MSYKSIPTTVSFTAEPEPRPQPGLLLWRNPNERGDRLQQHLRFTIAAPVHFSDKCWCVCRDQTVTSSGGSMGTAGEVPQDPHPGCRDWEAAAPPVTAVMGTGLQGKRRGLLLLLFSMKISEGKCFIIRLNPPPPSPCQRGSRGAPGPCSPEDNPGPQQHLTCRVEWGKSQLHRAAALLNTDIKKRVRREMKRVLRSLKGN